MATNKATAVRKTRLEQWLADAENHFTVKTEGLRRDVNEYAERIEALEREIKLLKAQRRISDGRIYICERGIDALGWHDHFHAVPWARIKKLIGWIFQFSLRWRTIWR